MQLILEVGTFGHILVTVPPEITVINGKEFKIQSMGFFQMKFLILGWLTAVELKAARQIPKT